jgi:outer membrane protein assembly factor BamB
VGTDFEDDYPTAAGAQRPARHPFGRGEGRYRIERVWKDPRAVPEVPVPLVYQGRVYTVTNGGTVSVFEKASGKLVYRSRLGAGGLYYASPVAAGGHVYFASGEGVVTVIRAGDMLEAVAHNDFGEPIFATPAIVDTKIYVRTTMHLYAFGQ